MNKQPILIDTDPGVDDAFCLAIGCGFSEYFDLKAVTTIGGNNATDITTRNALDLLKLYHRDDVRVGRGSDSYLEKEFDKPVEKFHGKNGLGNAIIPHSDRKPDELKACDLIYEVARECNGELIIVTVGPETNLALALLKYPDLKHLIKKFVVMGGSTDKGNVTPYAEANIIHDEKAAEIVFSSGVPLDMIGLNATHLTKLPRDVFDGLATDTRDDVKEFLQKLIDFRNGEPMHDAVAIATLISDFVTFKDAYCYVETKDPMHIGQTVCDVNSNNPNVRVAVDIDLNGYYQVIGEMLKCYRK